MTKRRSRRDRSLYWDEKRQRWVAEVTVGYTPAGKRIYRRGSGKTKTEAKNKLKEVIRDYEDGLAIVPHGYAVADAVTDWLAYGLNGRSASTVTKNTILCERHVIPDLGARKLRDLSASDVDRWLAAKAKILSTRTLQDLHGCLNRAINRAMARDKVKRNVVGLSSVPKGQPGRPSKSLTLDQAKAVMTAAEDNPLHAYVVISLVVGARTEELRTLTWERVDLDGVPDAGPPAPPSIQVWRSVREHGDTKTRKSRRTLALPLRGVSALRAHRTAQDSMRGAAGEDWQDTGLVFTSKVGTALDAANARTSWSTVTGSSLCSTGRAPTPAIPASTSWAWPPYRARTGSSLRWRGCWPPPLWRRHLLFQQDVAVQPGQRDGWRFVQVVPCRDHRRVGETAGAGRVRSIGEGARSGDPGLRGESFAPAGIGLRRGDDAGAAAGHRVPRVGDPARSGAGHDQADGHRVLLVGRCDAQRG